ncbi:MAG: esterase [Betaproteobacteria bacterium]|nr:MAG: esterase [Betaproteobacteria bacterium]
MAITHLLYLHGFRSSPQSSKARRMAAWVQQHRSDLHWWCPQLPPSPKEAIALIDVGIAAWPSDKMAVIGSSLGGFYATVVAERIGCKAVLLNPAVEPARDLAQHIGETTAWHSDDHFFFKPEFIAELRALKPRTITRPERYFAVIAKGDELLDWREMSARYVACRMKLLDAGDHALSDFDMHLPDVLRFLGLESPLTSE